MGRLILDTGVLIAVERGHEIRSDVVADDADIVLAAITASELLVGVALANDQHRELRRNAVEDALGLWDIVPFDLAVAREHAELVAHARRHGRPRGTNDLQIAATARATGRTVITTDQRAFDDLPGVRHLVI